MGMARDVMVDDAYISFRYARNLVRGEGLVFNPGERVEGYTNFLWTVLIAGGMAAGAEPEPVAETLAFLAAAGSLVLLAGLGQRLLRGPLALPATLLPPLLFAALGSEARHVVSGMETLLFVFLVLAAFSVLLWRWHGEEAPANGLAPHPPGPRLREVSVSGVLFSLATMTRPEGAMFTAIGGLIVLLGPCPGATEVGAGQAVGVRARLRATATFAGSFVALFGPFTAWRVAYYGHLFPNTFYAKVAGPLPEVVARGWTSLGRIMAEWPVWPVLVAAVLALLPIHRALRKSGVWFWLAGVVLTTWVSFVLVGGDFLAFFGPRMLMPALPFALLLAAEGIRRVATAWRPKSVGWLMMSAALVAFPLYTLVRPWPAPGGPLGGLASLHQMFDGISAWLLEASSTPALLAAPGIGVIPYETDWPTLDMFGLTDEHIAHDGHFDPAMPPRTPGQTRSTSSTSGRSS